MVRSHIYEKYLYIMIFHISCPDQVSWLIDTTSTDRTLSLRLSVHVYSVVKQRLDIVMCRYVLYDVKDPS